MGSFQDSDFSSLLNWVLPRAGGCVSPSVWELPEDKALLGAALSVAPSGPELSSALGVLWGGGEVVGNGTQGSRKSPLACPGDGRVEHRYSRHGFSWSRAVGGIARGQVLSSPGPTACKGLSGLNQLFWAMVWEDRGFSIQTSGWRRCRGWLPACCLLTLLWTLSWVTQEDNHSYYVSRLYGPSEPRSQELWVDVAKANRSQVKVHRILSNTHRQASMSAPVPGSAAPGWEAGGQPTLPGQWAWLWSEVWGLGSAFPEDPRGLDQSWGAHLWSWGPALDIPTPPPHPDKHGTV